MMSADPYIQVPAGWRLMRLEDVCYKITDGTHKTPNYKSTGVRFISIKNIRPFQPINWTNYEKYITVAEHQELTKRCKPEYDDILFPRIGTLGYAKRIDFDEEISIFVGLGLLKPKKELVRPKFLELWMNTPLINRLSHERANGSGRLTLPLEESRLFPVLVPPLSEQDEIVAGAEQQFTRLEAGVAGLRRVQANLKRYRAAVLKAACEGKLVPTEAELAQQNGRTYETGTQLLSRILTERRHRWNGKGKYKEPLKPDTENLPLLPKGWAWATVEQTSSWLLGSIQSGPFGSHLLHSEFVSEGILAIGIDNILDGRFSLGSNHRIKPEKYSVLRKFTARPGDVVVTVMATIGRVCVLPENLDPAIITKHCYRITPATIGIAPRFLALALRADAPTRRHIFGNVRGQTRPGINGPILKTAPVPVPPLIEQLRIVAEVERRLSVVEELETVVKANFQRATRLRQSILQRAFQGRLFFRPTI